MKQCHILKAICYLAAFIFSIWIIHQSQIITTLDQGDYSRAISAFLDGTANNEEYRHWEKPTLEWKFKESIAVNEVNNSSTVYFLINGLFQGAANKFFSLPLLSITSKIILILILAGLSSLVARELAWESTRAFFVWLLFVCAYFMAHNIYILNSFYQEHLFWLGLPLILCGFLDRNKLRSLTFIIFGSIAAGAAKTQFFYLPLLVTFFYILWQFWKGRRVSKIFCIGLTFVQILCILPLINNPYKALNFYHATYYGSYILLDQKNIQELGVPKETFRCIGSDRWGVKLKGVHGDERGETIESCFSDVSLRTSDVIRPFLRDPMVIWRMWRFAENSLWTAKPFHNFKEQPYIITQKGLDSSGVPYPFPENNFSLYLSDERENKFTHRVELISATALFLGLICIYLNWFGSLPLVILFLLSLLWSQIAIALFGEGFRDLGKHFAAAQLSYDLLIVLILILIMSSFEKLIKLTFRS